MAERSPVDVTRRDFVRYRLTPSQHVLGLLFSTAFMVPGILIWATDKSGSRPAGLGPGAFIALWVVSLWVVSVALTSSVGITLTPTAAVVHTLRRRNIPWCDVRAVRIENVMGTRTVVICEANGRSTRLRAPVSGFPRWDRRFEEKFHTIGRWWLDHRGPDWTPVTQRPWWDGWSTTD